MIRKLLNRFKDPLEVDIAEAEEIIEERKGENFDKLEDQIEEKRDTFKQKIEELQNLIDELEDFEDEKERAVVEDVVKNIKEERENLIEEISYPEDPRELESEIREFLNSFKTMSRKEAAVMKTIPVNKEMDEIIEKLENEFSEYRNFLKNEYSGKEGFEDIKEYKKQQKNLRAKIEEKEKELEELNVEELESKIEEKEKELNDLKESEKWSDYKQLKEELKETKERKQGLEENKGKAINKMQRGLKKLIYRIENTGLEFDGDIKILKKIRDRKKEDIDEISSQKIEETVKEAMRSMPEGLVSESQEQKFVEGVETLGNISNLRENIEEHKNEIEELREKIDNHEVIEKEEELASEKKELKTELHNIKQRKENLKDELKDLRKSLDKKEAEIKETVRSIFERDIEFTGDQERKD